MYAARYWASAHIEAKDPRGRTEFRSVWRGSNESSEDAARLVEARAREVASEIASGRADDHWYTYPRHPVAEPMIDEVVDDRGELVGAVTINRYGARVLNTARLVFVDVDRPNTGAKVGLLARLLRLSAPDPDMQGLRSRLSAWVSEDRSRGARVYETAAGLRYMIVNPHMDPCAEATHELMTRLGADRVYQTLCRSQQCFRARLTPKPWRIGMESVRIGPGAFAQDDATVERWLRDYESRGAGFGVCRVVEEIGNLEPPDEACEQLIAMHDEHTVRDPGVPLA